MTEPAFEHEPDFVDFILSPKAIRERSALIYKQAQEGATHFEIHEDKLDEVAQYVKEVTLENYPDLNIPFHSRWGHFQAAGRDRLSVLDASLEGLDAEEQAKAKLDLVIVSVLLDAGAGPSWQYTDGPLKIGRSEGLAVASFNMFFQGAFSSDPSQPLRVDAVGLMGLSKQALEAGFQVSTDNPLVGVDGRVDLLQSLARTMFMRGDMFGQSLPRPGNLFSFLASQATDGKVAAASILDAVLRGLGPIWPGRLELSGTNLGDVWQHRLLGPLESVDSFVPFHKLSQWMTYSMVEPIEAAGLKVDGAGELTGLAEYRNGGLLLDLGFLSLRDPMSASKAHAPNDELIIEWRALTVHALGLIGQKVCELLGKTSEEFPLARVLEGGTWRAGRKIAAELRSDGTPPLKIDSDATVF